MVAGEVRRRGAVWRSSRSRRGMSIARLRGFDGATVFAEMTQLARKHGATNLGQGFPDFAPPPFLAAAVAAAAQVTPAMQYCPPQGHARLVEELARYYSARLGRSVAGSELCVTVGATGALNTIMSAVVDREGEDEVLLLDPAYDSYAPSAAMAGAKVVRLSMLPRGGRATGGVRDAFDVDVGRIVEHIGPKTRLVLLNTPHNPTGRCFSAEELSRVLEAVNRTPRGLLAVDEVYEWMATSAPHARAAALAGAQQGRVVTISSAGKTLSATGLKVGWVHAQDPDIIRRMVVVNQWTQFCVSTPLQEAVAQSLATAQEPFGGCSSYFDWVGREYHRKRDLLVDGLRSAGLQPLVPEGGFFVMARVPEPLLRKTPAAFLQESTPACPVMTPDWAFARWMTVDGKVAAIPPSAFFLDAAGKHRVRDLLRFAYCKADATISEGTARLGQWVARQ
jgi:aspartate/methionine/tyrosine aminotransferase